MDASPQGKLAAATKELTIAPPIKGRIYDAALVLFARRGYSRSSVRDIVEMAGTTAPMLYYYFASKQGLYAHILAVATRRLLASIESAVPENRRGSVTASARLEASLCSFLRFCQDNCTEVQLIFNAWFSGDSPVEGPPMVAVYEQMMAQMSTLLQDGIDRGEFRSFDVMETAQALIGIMTNYVARILVGHETLEPADHSGKIVDILERGLTSRTE